MQEVWDLLQEEYGQPMDVCNEIIRHLRNFKFSSAAKSENQKFHELNRQWNQAYADLGELNALDNKAILMDVAQKLPSATSRSQYVLFKQQMGGAATELEVRVKFMADERKQQRNLEKLELAVEPKKDAVKSERT